MRSAYALLGLLFILVVGGALYFTARMDDENRKNEQGTIVNQQEETMALHLSSSAFTHNGFIPAKYACDGENISPPLEITGVPEGTESLVLLMDDPDIPQVFKEQRGIDDFDHWAVFNLHPSKHTFGEGEDFKNEDEVYAMQGINSAGKNAYTGPCPPTEYEPTEHRYIFTLYALDTVLLGLHAGATQDEIKAAMEGHILEQTQLIGRYDRAK